MFPKEKIFVLLLAILPILSFAQDIDVGDVEWRKVIVKEWNVDFFLNTNGGGIGFQQGRTPNYFDKHFWEIDFVYNVHHKAVRARNPYFADARGFAYGKLCDLFFLHGGYDDDLFAPWKNALDYTVRLRFVSVFKPENALILGLKFRFRRYPAGGDCRCRCLYPTHPRNR